LWSDRQSIRDVVWTFPAIPGNRLSSRRSLTSEWLKDLADGIARAKLDFGLPKYVHDAFGQKTLPANDMEPD
jgi:hypothetical protein